MCFLCFHFFWYFKWSFSIGFDGCEKYEYSNIRFLHSNNSSADDVTYFVEGLLVAYQCHTYQAFIVLIKFYSSAKLLVLENYQHFVVIHLNIV